MAKSKQKKLEISGINREQWLHGITEKFIRPWFEQQGYKIPAYRASCGFPSTRALSLKSRRIGECWHSTASKTGHREIFISPTLDDSLDVLQVLVHELIHAALPDDAGHKAPFKQAMKKFNLGGKATATVRTPEFDGIAQNWVVEFGDYPHSAINSSALARKKQTTRLIKVECMECGYTVRVTRKWLDEAGAPICPNHIDTAMEEA